MINAIITDFDGTLVNTFEANLCAYQKAFQEVGLCLSSEDYTKCFGFRFDRFMDAVNVQGAEIRAQIKRLKQMFYPDYFDKLVLNKALLSLIDDLRKKGCHAAIASTAQKANLINVVHYLGIGHCFDLIFCGMDVKEGKPSPEIYLKAMEALRVSPEETLIFEDSEVGIEAARKSGAKYLRIIM